MKKYSILFLCLTMILSQSSFAQKMTRKEKKAQKELAKAEKKASKAEKKANKKGGKTEKKEQKKWKKKAKAYLKNPLMLKDLTEKKAAAEESLSSVNQELESIRSADQEKDDELAKLKDEIISAREQIRVAKENLKKKPKEAPTHQVDITKGVVFKVQIGSFKNKDLSKYFDNNPNFGGIASKSGEQQITLGVFRDYWEADTFKKYLREMGVKDAWIVPYRDGTRVAIKDVMDKIGEEKK